MISVLIIILSILAGLMMFLAEDSYMGIFWRLCWGFMVFIVVLMVGTLLVLFLEYYLIETREVTYHEYSTQELLSFSGLSSVEGNFFLGSGQVDGDINYYYLVENKGVYEIEKIGRRNIKIKYSDEPRIVVKQPKFESESLNEWFNIEGRHQRKYFYIPEGSINYDFKVKPF